MSKIHNFLHFYFLLVGFFMCKKYFLFANLINFFLINYLYLGFFFVLHFRNLIDETVFLCSLTFVEPTIVIRQIDDPFSSSFFEANSKDIMILSLEIRFSFYYFSCSLTFFTASNWSPHRINFFKKIHMLFSRLRGGPPSKSRSALSGRT